MARWRPELLEKMLLDSMQRVPPPKPGGQPGISGSAEVHPVLQAVVVSQPAKPPRWLRYL